MYQTEDIQDLIPEKDMLFTVIWKKCPVLTFDPDGGTVEHNVPGGEKYTSTFKLNFYKERGLWLDDEFIKRDNYVFAGWKVIAGTGVGEVYKSEELNGSYRPVVDSMLQAMWKDASGEIIPAETVWVNFDAGDDYASVNLGPGGRTAGIQC